MSQRKAASRQALLSAPPRLRVNQLLPSAISASSARAPFFPGPCFFYRNLYRRAHSGRGHVAIAPFALHQSAKPDDSRRGFAIGAGPAIGQIEGSAPCRFTSMSLRSEEHTSELQSLMRISYAVFCLKKKKKNKNS